MLFASFFSAAFGLVAAAVPAMAAAAQCSSPIGPGTAGPNDPFWMQTIKHPVGFLELNELSLSVFYSIQWYLIT